jgi:hypothetical protein
MAPGPGRANVTVMFGRALFALVWLIIAAGLLLPMYPRDAHTPSFAAANSILSATDFMASRCEDCPVAEDAGAVCRTDCPCGHLLPAAFSLEHSVGLSVILVIRPASPGRPSEAPPGFRLPAI